MFNRYRYVAAATSALLVLAACGSSQEADDPSPQETVASPNVSNEGSVDAGQSPAPEPEAPEEGVVVEVAVKGGQVKTSNELVEVALGETVVIEVTSDAADTIHVHGYDHKEAVEPGRTARMEFKAGIPGTFEVEFEEAGLALFELRVR